MKELSADQLLSDCSVQTADPSIVYWHRLSAANEEAELRNVSIQFNIKSFSVATSGDELYSALVGWGLGETKAAAAHISIIIVDSYRDPRLLSYCAFLKENRWNALLVKQVGVKPWIGPFVGASGACMTCLQKRLKIHDALSVYLELNTKTLGPAMPPPAYTSSSMRYAAQRAAFEVYKSSVLGRQSSLRDHLLVLNLSTGEDEFHPVIRSTDCEINQHAVIGSTWQPPLLDLRKSFAKAS